VVCIASGPSLTEGDCELVRASGHPTVVTNTTFRLAPWASVLFAMDMKWWQAHGQEVVESAFAGRKVSTAYGAHKYGAETTYGVGWWRGFGNSGACALSFAVEGRPDKVLMLGYDCQETGGRKHWHADHGPGLSNARSMPQWPRAFKDAAAHARGRKVRVVNVSRETSLTCFDRGTLEAEL